MKPRLKAGQTVYVAFYNRRIVKTYTVQFEYRANNEAMVHMRCDDTAGTMAWLKKDVFTSHKQAQAAIAARRIAEAGR